MRYVKISIILLFIHSSIYGQGVIDTEHKTLIRNEKTFHISLNSNGWGGGYTYGKMLNIYKKNLYSIEFVIIKDSKELKLNNPYQPNFRRFVYGKNNIFYNARFGLGSLNNIYKKGDKGGIDISWLYQGGPLLGILKPVYYVTGINPIKTEKFSSSLHTASSILGGASYFEGLNELKIVPGLFVRIGGSFEFSKQDIQVNALEGGITLDIFAKKIDIMANDKNQFYFLSLFISYRFGKIINPRDISTQTYKDE